MPVNSVLHEGHAAKGYEPEGRVFESLRAHHLNFAKSIHYSSLRFSKFSPEGSPLGALAVVMRSSEASFDRK